MSEQRKRASGKYLASKVEARWQRSWDKHPQTSQPNAKLPKKYVLIEFPYPSGDGLHVGHARPYCAMDAIARQSRLAGNNVLFPIGWDAFGLPTENYAIKTGQHPRKVTNANIANFRRQMKMLGLSFDWSREVDTTDPAYYKWTQWIFLQLFEKGLAYQATMPINWCPSCKIGLANEEVVNGRCERCGAEVTRRTQKQWMLKITAYADRLLKDLDTVDYLPKIKTQQINWIGKSEGAEIKFQVKSNKEDARRNVAEVFKLPSTKRVVTVFTTRPDTIFGATYLVLAPEHELVTSYKLQISNYGAVEKYIKQAAKKSDLDRTDLAKVKTGVELKGIRAINPANNEAIPIWVADYVLSTYGTGAIMAVPGHDSRDNEFAKVYSLPIKYVIEPVIAVAYSGVDNLAVKEQEARKQIYDNQEVYDGHGRIINSALFVGYDSDANKDDIISVIEKNGMGKKAIQYKLRDWVFSRQHYWGEPIPIVHCDKCGVVPIPEKDLPVELPHVKKYEPTDTGESPLANMTEWVNTKCPQCGGPAQRETDTMPNWAGSSWYYLRYCDPHNDKKFADFDKMKYWLPVDIYNGGMEHTVLHLLYSRFWHKFLFDQKLVPFAEPYIHRHSHGMVLAEDGRKMSKSWGNVINPDDVVKQYGADTLRMYEMFMGPFEDAIPWSTQGMVGVYRFLDRVYRVISSLGMEKKTLIDTPGMSIKIHKLVKKVTEDLERFRFNTVVSSMMEYFNARDFASKLSHQGRLQDKNVDYEAVNKFLVLLFPFAPHIASELWEQLNGGDIQKESWPKYDSKYLKDENFELIVQINGKVRGKIPNTVMGIDESGAVAAVTADDKLNDKIVGYQKVVYVPNRLINFIV